MVDKDVLSAPYNISFDTLALLPYFHNGKLYTKVIERRKEFIIKAKPIQIVKSSCEMFGGSLKQATLYAKKSIGDYQKTPIIVAQDYGIPYIFIPTQSPYSDQNVWISVHAIDIFFANKDGNGCKVYLEHDITFDVSASFTTLTRQYAFAHMLQKKFNQNLKRFRNPDEFLEH